jgi:hypothetical protein
MLNLEDLETEPPDSMDDITLSISPNGKFVATANQGADYHHRGPELDNVSVWDFVAQVEKVRKVKRSHKKSKDRDDNDELVESNIPQANLNGIGNDSGCLDGDEDKDESTWLGDILLWNGRTRPKVKFNVGHLEDQTKILNVISPDARRVPVPIGPALPRRDRDDYSKLKHARLMLILFKPWRHCSDLLDDGQSWLEAYDEFLNTCSSEIIRRIDNMQLLHECKDSRDAHYANRRNRKAGDGVALNFVRCNADGSLGDYDESAVLEHLDSIDDCFSNRKDRSDKNIRDATRTLIESGMLSELTDDNEVHSTGESEHELVMEKEPALEQLWGKNYSDRRDQWKNAAAGKNARTVPVEAPASSLSGTNSLIQNGEAFRRPRLPLQANAEAGVRQGPVPISESEMVEPVDNLMDQVIHEFTLNTEQIRAFKIVAQHSTDRTAPPLRMYIGGPGGTGKSRVIDALKEFFKQRGEERRLRLASYTGVAARNISGMTLHAALGMGQHGESTKKSGKALRDLMSMWDGVDYLFVDEVSMVGCTMLYNISVALCAAKGEANTAFGGVNMIFAGDFYQLPPVGQTRLYAHVEKNIGRKKKKSSGIRTVAASTESGKKNICGKLLWLTVKTVVLLTEPMRQIGPENEEFVSLLNRLRYGRCTNADFELLNTRLMSNLNIDWTQEPWSSARIIVNENEMKDRLNIRAAHDFAKKTGRQLHWYYAEDKIARKTVPVGDLGDRLMKLDSGKSNQRMGKIPLVVGMPVVISQNFDVPGGVVNGSKGILKKVRYYLDQNGRRHAISCVVECEDTEDDLVPGLPSHHVVALEDTTSIKIEHPYSHKSCTLHRTQLPIQPGFVMTAYKSQGKTLEAAAVNLVDCHGTESAYVMVSRVTSLEGLVIISPFSKERICCRTSEDLRNETARLEMLALQTIIEYGAEDEVVRAKASIQAQFSLDLDDEEERTISEDENSVPEDSWVRLKRKQQENQLLIQPRRRQKRDLNAPLLDTTRSTAAAGPSTRSAPTSARVQLPNGRDHGSEGMDHSGTVSTASQRLINRRKRRRLDEPLARVSDILAT